MYIYMDTCDWWIWMVGIKQKNLLGYGLWNGNGSYGEYVDKDWHEKKNWQICFGLMGWLNTLSASSDWTIVCLPKKIHKMMIGFEKCHF